MAQRTAPEGSTRGATAVQRDRHGLGWVPWAALAALAALLILFALLTRNAMDNGDAAGLDVRNDRTNGATESGSQVPSAEPGSRPGTQAGSATGSGSGSGSQGAAGTGSATATGAASFTAGGQPVLALASSGALKGVVGQQASGRGLTVQQVVGDEVFWVGDSPASRVLVHLAPPAKGTPAESPFQVREGQRIDVTGTVTALQDPATFGVEAAEGADQARTQGAFIEATKVALST